MVLVDDENQAKGQSHLCADQSAILRFLQDPASYAAWPGAVESAPEIKRIDTHGAIVFLAGAQAFKIKRAVKYPYMDFSTLEKRERACRRELVLNVRTAPSLYRKVLAITQNEDGQLAFDGDGQAVEWVLVMCRFRQEDLLNNLAESGGLTEELMVDLADAIADFHAAAPLPPGGEGDRTPRGAKAMEWVVVENNEEFAERRDIFPPALAAELAARSLALLARHSALLDERAASGYQRLCHGDLHLRNVVLIAGRPTLFDAIEFNDSIACIDVFYDLAFLLMDLEHRGLGSLANRVLNRYLQARDDLSGLALLPLFLSARAAVRAKVAASLESVAEDPAQKAARSEEALSYFHEALRFLETPPPRLVAIGGLSGSGKTSLGRSLAPGLGARPGAVHLRSDVLRKAMAGVDEQVRLPPEAYSREAGEAVYQSLLDNARQVLMAGHAVVVDGVFARAEERAAIEQVARDLGFEFTGLWLEASPEVLTARVNARCGDASDATAEVVRKQLTYDLGPMRWQLIDSNGDLETVTLRARHLLEESI